MIGRAKSQEDSMHKEQKGFDWLPKGNISFYGLFIKNHYL